MVLIMNSIKKQFNHSFKWNLWGSIIFETLKMAHNIILLRLVAPSLYGLIGSIFAITYLAVRLADFGATNTLAPYFHLFKKTKSSFKTLIFKGFLRPVFMTTLITMTAALLFCYNKIAIQNHMLTFIVIPLLVLLETLRMFFRQFLHILFQSKAIIITELALFFGYIAIVWIPLIGFSVTPSLNLIFLPYLADSILALVIFFYFMFKFYKTLPEQDYQHSEAMWSKLTRTRILNYFLRIGKNMFTSNLLTPLFALQFGLKQAGIFYFASVLATSIQAIVKTILNYSGNALFAHVKTHENKQKQDAFSLVGNKLIVVLLPIIVFLIFNYKKLLVFGSLESMSNSILTLSGLYLIITFTEFFFSLYEQFYILEEAVFPVVALRFLEFLAFYGVITLYSYTSPALILTGIILVRFVSFLAMAVIAYSLWNIKPTFKLSLRYIVGCLSISLVCMFLLSIA